ncbi:MAG TPA: IclR family transcriptional regulator [bacterium]|nr:IclR family transcriptional regulator [bacterium]
MNGAYALQSVERVIRVLGCFTPNAPELRLTDLSLRAGVSKTQILRIASTLETGGYLFRDPETKRYRLGIRLFHLGMIVHNSMDLRRIAHPYLRRLAEATKETARLIIPHASGPICIDLVETPRGIRVFAQLGSQMPWNAGTSPKLILAYLSEGEREQILMRGGFKRYTQHTIIDPDELREEIRSIRGRDSYCSVGDLDKDAFGVSGPIFDHRDRIVGAVNVAAPTSRVSKAEVKRFIELVRDASAQISHQLGHHGDHRMKSPRQGTLNPQDRHRVGALRHIKTKRKATR